MNKEFSLQLDAIRGYSAFAVLVAHIYAWFMLPIVGLKDRVGMTAGSLAYYAVLIFFVLSGYLITHSLLLNRQKNGSIDVPAFLSARALRILPPFAFAIVLSIGVSMLISAFRLHGYDSFKLPTDMYLVRDNLQLVAKDVIFSTLLSNGVVPNTNSIITNGALWSLSIEVWMYFIALLIALAWEGGFRDKTALASLIGLGGVLLLLSYKPLLFEFGAYWFLGAAFRMHQESKKGAMIRLGIFAAMAIPGLLICVTAPYKLIPANQGVLSLPINLAVLIVLTAILQLVPGRFTFWEHPGRYLAHSSYTLYIIHFPILAMVFSLFHERFVHWSSLGRIAFLIGVACVNLVIAHFAALFLEDRARWRRYCCAVFQKNQPILRIRP